MEKVFSYKTTKGNKVMIYHNNKQVTILQGNQALKFLAKIEAADIDEAQLIMAKATGNFKRGNERVGKDKLK